MAATSPGAGANTLTVTIATPGGTTTTGVALRVVGSVTGGTGPYTFSWVSGAGPPYMIFDSPNSPSTTAYLFANASQTANLIVLDSVGGKGTASVTLTFGGNLGILP